MAPAVRWPAMRVNTRREVRIRHPGYAADKPAPGTAYGLRPGASLCPAQPLWSLAKNSLAAPVPGPGRDAATPQGGVEADRFVAELPPFIVEKSR